MQHKIVGVLIRKVYTAQVGIFFNIMKKSLKKSVKKSMNFIFFHIFFKKLNIRNPILKGTSWQNFDIFISQPTPALSFKKKVTYNECFFPPGPFGPYILLNHSKFYVQEISLKRLIHWLVRSSAPTRLDNILTIKL